MSPVITGQPALVSFFRIPSNPSPQAEMVKLFPFHELRVVKGIQCIPVQFKAVHIVVIPEIYKYTIVPSRLDSRPESHP